MPLFTIDQNLCRQDGICAAECPLGIIRWKKNQFPEPVTGAEDICINCGHCVAVCPHGALSLDAIPSSDFAAIDRTMTLSPEKVEHFMRSRRSIRSFKKTPVDKKVLEEIIRIASFAPSGHNCQPVHWRILNGQDVIREHSALVIDWMKLVKAKDPQLAALLHLDKIITAWKFKIDTVTRDAPTLILAQGETDHSMAPQACTIAMTWLDLAAPSFGIGTCWCGYFKRAAEAYPPLAGKLGQDQGLTTYAVMMAGYPKYPYQLMPPRNAAKITWTE